MNMPWYSLFSFSCFLFRNNVIREHFDENNFRRCYGFFIPKVLDHSYVHCSLPTNTRHLTIEDFMDMCVKPAQRHLTYYLCFFFPKTSPVFKFNLMLIE